MTYDPPGTAATSPKSDFSTPGMLGIGMLLLSGSTALMGEYREGRQGAMYCEEVHVSSTAVQCAWTT